MLERVRLDVVRVPRGVDVLHAATHVGGVGALELVKPPLVLTVRRDVERDQLSHLVESAIRGVGKLDESQDVQVVHFAVEHVQVKLRVPGVPLEQLLVHESDLVVIAGREEDQFNLFLRTVREDDRVTPELRDVRLASDVAVAEVMHDRVVHQGGARSEPRGQAWGVRTWSGRRRGRR